MLRSQRFLCLLWKGQKKIEAHYQGLYRRRLSAGRKAEEIPALGTFPTSHSGDFVPPVCVLCVSQMKKKKKNQWCHIYTQVSSFKTKRKRANLSFKPFYSSLRLFMIDALTPLSLVISIIRTYEMIKEGFLFVCFTSNQISFLEQTSLKARTGAVTPLNHFQHHVQQNSLVSWIQTYTDRETKSKHLPHMVALRWMIQIGGNTLLMCG